MQATPTKIIDMLRNYQRSLASAQAHRHIHKVKLLSDSDHKRLEDSVARTKLQLIQAVGDNPIAQILLAELIG